MIFGYEKVDRFQIDDEIFYRYTIFIVKLNFDREGAEIMEKDFTLSEVSIMTGLTTRTLRNYLKMNILSGEKIAYKQSKLSMLNHNIIREHNAAPFYLLLFYDHIASLFKERSGGNRCMGNDFPLSSIF